MTAGSKRQMHHYRTNKIITLDACKGSAVWKKLVANCAGIACRKQGWKITSEALVLIGTFIIKRPQSHYRVSKKLGVAALRDTAPDFHTQKPDALKLMRAVEDAMTGIVYKDDAQIIKTSPLKLWGTGHATLITLRLATPEDLE